MFWEHDKELLATKWKSISEGCCRRLQNVSRKQSIFAKVMLFHLHLSSVITLWNYDESSARVILQNISYSFRTWCGSRTVITFRPLRKMLETFDWIWILPFGMKEISTVVTVRAGLSLKIAGGSSKIEQSYVDQPSAPEVVVIIEGKRKAVKFGK